MKVGDRLIEQYGGLFILSLYRAAYRPFPPTRKYRIRECSDCGDEFILQPRQYRKRCGPCQEEFLLTVDRNYYRNNCEERRAYRTRQYWSNRCLIPNKPTTDSTADGGPVSAATTTTPNPRL